MKVKNKFLTGGNLHNLSAAGMVYRSQSAGDDAMKVEKIFAREDASIEYLAYADSMSFQPCYLFYRRTQPVMAYTYPVHIHPNYELIIPERNRYCCLLDRKPVTTLKGEALLIQPGQSHEDSYEANEVFHSFRFQINSGKEQTLSRLFAAGILPEQQVLKIDNTKSVARLLQLVYDEAMYDEEGNYNVQNSLFQAIFYLCIAACPEVLFNVEYLQRSQKKYVQGRILAVFEHFLFGNPTLEELCANCELTTSSLTRRCREFFAQPPLKAFMSYKIHYVKQKMIDEPDLKLKELSDLFGFENQFHFSRVFKHYAGLSPSTFLIERNR